MAKRGFVLFNDYAEQFCSLSDVSAGKLIKAIFEYTTSGTKPKLPPKAEMAFMFIRNSLDENKDKYEKICEKRREAGKAGGVASGMSRSSKCLKNEANEADTDTDTETDTDTVTVTDTDTEHQKFRRGVRRKKSNSSLDFDLDDFFEKP